MPILALALAFRGAIGGGFGRGEQERNHSLEVL